MLSDIYAATEAAQRELGDLQVCLIIQGVDSGQQSRARQGSLGAGSRRKPATW